VCFLQKSTIVEAIRPLTGLWDFSKFEASHANVKFARATRQTDLFRMDSPAQACGICPACTSYHFLVKLLCVLPERPFVLNRSSSRHSVSKSTWALLLLPKANGSYKRYGRN
jgi:hypothetical protein